MVALPLLASVSLVGHAPQRGAPRADGDAMRAFLSWVP
jgi:hypothetical protein